MTTHIITIIKQINHHHHQKHQQEQGDWETPYAQEPYRLLYKLNSKLPEVVGLTNHFHFAGPTDSSTNCRAIGPTRSRRREGRETEVGHNLLPDGHASSDRPDQATVARKNPIAFPKQLMRASCRPALSRVLRCGSIFRARFKMDFSTFHKPGADPLQSVCRRETRWKAF